VLSIYNHQIYCRIHQEIMRSDAKNKPYRHFSK
jgi:hypothetical protein